MEIQDVGKKYDRKRKKKKRRGRRYMIQMNFTYFWCKYI